MPFTGFDNVKYPEYEVITPQTELSFNLRTMTVQEEERMKGSLVTPIKVTEHLNKCIYETLVTKPECIKNFDDFLKQVTIKDREVLLYGLYHVTYEEVRNYDIKCSSCAKEYPVTVQISDTFNFNKYPGKDVLSKKVKVPLPITKGVNAYIKQPSLYDEITAYKSLGSRPGSTLERISQILIIDKFEQESLEGKTKTYKDNVDILDAFMSLPAKDKRKIHSEYLENFGKYSMELKMQTTCTNCGHTEVVDIDLVEQFFRLVYTS